MFSKHAFILFQQTIGAKIDTVSSINMYFCMSYRLIERERERDLKPRRNVIKFPEKLW